MKRLLIITLLASVCAYTNAQLIAFTPNFPTDNGSITITMDPTKGNKGLQGFAGPVFLHTGVITNLSTSQSDWKYVQGTWATATAPQATLSGGKWTFTIPNIRTFYNVPAGEQILKITVLFRNQAGTLVQRNIDGSDMYLPVYQTGQFAVRFLQPAMQPMFTPIPEPIDPAATSVAAQAVTSANATLTLRFKTGSGGSFTTIGNASNATTVSGTASSTSTCEQQLTVEAVNGATTLRDTINWFRPPASAPTGARPAGVQDGITYQDNNTSAVFIINAPGKSKISLVGDFNNWLQTCDGLMKKDGNFFWTKITGLTPGVNYRFQYIVDDTIRVADPYSELILDPFNDQFIPAANFPNMIPYPTGKTTGGIVGVIKSGDTYTWTDQGYVRPNKYNLNVYELHMRDFLGTQNYQTLRDTLPYLSRLGINCIKIMPVNEFDGNNSWGYNPAYFFALDKAYGTKKAFKDFINDAHKWGIAVVIDAVLNHATGQAAQAAMWWNKATSKPANDNPYFYVDAQHPFNVYNDFNHNSAMTRYLTERFIEYWLTEYKLDGFRWDLSKGFTNQNCLGDQACWDAYNQDRINIWQNYYNKMQSASNGSYCILEHLGADSEEYELAARGMLLWGKMTSQFTENTMGFSNSNADINRAYWINRGTFSNPGNQTFISDKPGIMVYAESHDEERVMYNNLNFGNNTNGSHNVRNLATALSRTEAMAAILLAIPGPKMIWQFGEVGYDFSINRCENGTINSSCRTSPKPVRWDYWTTPVPNGRRRLYETFAAMNKLRLQKPDAFNRATVTTGTNFGSSLWKSVVLNHSSLKLVVVANFNVNQATQQVTFPTAGTYYDYTRGGTFTAFGTPQNVTLNAGEYRVWIDQNIAGGLVTSVRDQIANATEFKLSVYPNPVQQSATVRYELPKSGQVSIQLMNIQGQVVATKHMGFQLKGLQVFELDRNSFAGNRLTAGSYVLQVRVDNVVRYEKIMVQQ